MSVRRLQAVCVLRLIIFTTRFTSLQPRGEDDAANEGEDKSLLDGEGWAMKLVGRFEPTQNEPIINIYSFPSKLYRFFMASVL